MICQLELFGLCGWFCVSHHIQTDIVLRGNARQICLPDLSCTGASARAGIPQQSVLAFYMLNTTLQHTA